MVEVSKPVNLGQLSAELGGVPLWSSGPDADGVTTVWGEVDSVKVAGAIPAVPDAPGGQGTQSVQVAALRAQVAALTATVRALAAAVDALDDEEQTRADALAAIADRLG